MTLCTECCTRGYFARFQMGGSIMFSFTDPNPTIIERNTIWGDAEEKYPDKFMIVIKEER